MPVLATKKKAITFWAMAGKNISFNGLFPSADYLINGLLAKNNLSQNSMPKYPILR